MQKEKIIQELEELKNDIEEKEFDIEYNNVFSIYVASKFL